jgi:hypothetical protein
MPRRNHSQPATGRSRRSLSPVSMRKLGGCRPGNCPCRRIPSLPGTPGPHSRRRTRHRGRLRTERKAITRTTAHPTTRRISTSTSKQTATRTRCKEYVLNPSCTS